MGARGTGNIYNQTVMGARETGNTHNQTVMGARPELRKKEKSKSQIRVPIGVGNSEFIFT